MQRQNMSGTMILSNINLKIKKVVSERPGLNISQIMAILESSTDLPVAHDTANRLVQSNITACEIYLADDGRLYASHDVYEESIKAQAKRESANLERVEREAKEAMQAERERIAKAERELACEDRRIRTERERIRYRTEKERRKELGPLLKEMEDIGSRIGSLRAEKAELQSATIDDYKSLVAIYPKWKKLVFVRCFGIMGLTHDVERPGLMFRLRGALPRSPARPPAPIGAEVFKND